MADFVIALPTVMGPVFDWEDLNPLKAIGNAAAVAVTAGWQSFMNAMWAGGLWLTGFTFRIVDAFTSPDLSADGVMRDIFPVTCGIGAGLALILGFVQVGLAAWQRDGKGVARLLVGLGQFGLAWAGMLGVGAALTVATAGLTQGLLQVAVGSPSFAKVDLFASFQLRQGVDAAAATVLGVLGVFLVFAAIGYLLMMLVRAGALMILLATSPISAAGLLSEGTRAWFWKSLRWFLAALMVGPLAALVLGIGKRLTDGVLSGAGQSTESAVGAAVVGTVLVLLSAFCPLILFRLLAFVDPGTTSGASFRASLDAAGGVAGLLGGQSQAPGGSEAATAQASNGSSQGEADATGTTQGRVAAAMGAFGTVAGRLSAVGQNAATYGADILGAAGVGHQQPYYGSPAYTGNRPNTPRTGPSPGGQAGQSNDTPPDPDGPDTPPPIPPAPPAPAAPAAGGGKPGTGPVGGGPGASAGGGAAGAAEGAAAAAL